MSRRNGSSRLYKTSTSAMSLRPSVSTTCPCHPSCGCGCASVREMRSIDRAGDRCFRARRYTHRRPSHRLRVPEIALGLVACPDRPLQMYRATSGGVKNAPRAFRRSGVPSGGSRALGVGTLHQLTRTCRRDAGHEPSMPPDAPRAPASGPDRRPRIGSVPTPTRAPSPLDGGERAATGQSSLWSSSGKRPQFATTDLPAPDVPLIPAPQSRANP